MYNYDSIMLSGVAMDYKNNSIELLFITLQKLSIVTPVFIKKSAAKILALLFYKFHKKYYNTARINLDFIYEDKLSDEKKEQIIKDMFYNLAQNFGSFIENQGISKEKLLKKVTFKNDEILLNAMQEKRPIVFITAHQGNWEILPLAISAKYAPITGVGRPLKQPWLDKILRKNREQFGINMIDKRGAMRLMVKTIKEKKILGLLIDQNLPGEIVEFMGKKASHTTAAALLARKFNAIVIPCFITRVGFEKYAATFYEPIEIEKSNDLEKDILIHTQKQAKITEEVIRKKPHEWLWIHRRWKKVYPQIYKRHIK